MRRRRERHDAGLRLDETARHVAAVDDQLRVVHHDLIVDVSMIGDDDHRVHRLEDVGREVDAVAHLAFLAESTA